MRVVQATRFGGPEVLVPSEAPDPLAGPGQVVVDVLVVSVLFVETQIRRGHLGEYFDVKPPYVPGDGAAGHSPSARAWPLTGSAGRSSPGQANTAVTPSGPFTVESLIGVPARLSLRQAAALLHDGITALGLLDAAQLKPDEWVLVTASAGGLGSLLVQLAHAAGARAIGPHAGRRSST
jgi:NADPH2:quinone reductase